jgi:rhodanese-related sulfurtransferase
MRKSRFEPLLDLALIIVAVAFLASLIARYVKKEATDSPLKPPLEIGTRLELPGVEWGQSDATLLLVLSTKCTFCAESMPFYKRIVQETGPRTRLIALLPQNTSDARQYLQDNGVTIDDVRQLSPGTVGVSGVPTLILTDSQGAVRDFWFGKLGPHIESLVLSRLKGEASEDGISIAAGALREALAKKEKVVVLSIEQRDVFERGHINNSINIPFDELETRMDDELKSADKVVIYEQSGQRYAYEAFEILKNNGFKDVSILRGGFQKWKESEEQGVTQ